MQHQDHSFGKNDKICLQINQGKTSHSMNLNPTSNLADFYTV